jgi:putative transcriptional regulator
VSKLGRELSASLRDAAGHAEGKPVCGTRITVVEVPDVRRIRRKLRMSQVEFAAAYRIPLATVKNWEQGRRAPDAPAAAYLRAIARRPKLIQEAVAA